MSAHIDNNNNSDSTEWTDLLVMGFFFFPSMTASFCNMK